jgi:hypothetical protein
MPETDSQAQNSQRRTFGIPISTNSVAENSNKSNSLSKRIGFNINIIKCSPDHQNHSNKAKSTAIINRTMNAFSKST